MLWKSFSVGSSTVRAEPPRSLRTPQGVGDRLRTAAFAEIQAREAFLWAADRYQDAPPGCRDAWRALGEAEDRHLGWLMARLAELKIDPKERPVSERLWLSLTARPTAKDFAFFMAAAEQRGRDAGLLFAREMKELDPLSAEIFGRIAHEEIEHIELAARYF